ncbi:hypothetical protein [Amphritea pacifica]|uniref:Phosphotyrosine protein phosphatase I domain-containing protein n=1 Tax=Amphritea pacifica TaxID=2811233 RepID=A0ABS2W9R1_9GAMM|nr:hypothetical protein [Amphritea pacifica]MBN0988459.1 hypothetical protein [Amphritea pacifica]MBN1007929.1 hypothetical protein [Amphritea pacifica]
MNTPYKVLFVCRHNSTRSQIAEALTNKMAHGRVVAKSAGPEPLPVPKEVAGWVSQLLGGDIKPESKSLDDIALEPFDTIITLCDKSHDALPELPTDQQHIRWDFHHADNTEDLKHMEIEISERLNLMLQAKGLI